MKCSNSTLMNVWCGWGLGDLPGYLRNYSEKWFNHFFLAAMLPLFDDKHIGSKYNTSCARPRKTSPAWNRIALSNVRTQELVFYLPLLTKAHPFVDLAQYNHTLHKLVSENYLKPSTILSHLSPCDKCIQYETEEKKKITGFPTAKEQREAKEIAQSRLKRQEEEAEQVGMVGLLI